VINPSTSNDSRGLPLRLNQCQAFGNKPDSACIENSVAQAGVWVDITFAQDDEISVGSVVVNNTGSVVINEGSNHSSSQVDAVPAGITLFPADSGRVKGTVVNTSTSESVWVGNNTASELQHANYKTICEEIPPGGRWEWKNAGAISVRSDVATVSLATRKEF
jgi:hypothetical protein